MSKLVPKLRFKEFSGEWEEKELNEISKFITEKIQLSKLSLNNYISTENILANFGGINKSSKLPNIKNVTKFKMYDILMSNIRPYLKKIWLAYIEGGASNDIIIMRAKDDNNYKFLFYTVQNDKFIDYVMQGAKGVKMPRGDIVLIKKYSISLPTPKEQQKIANTLSSLDSLIEAQQRKVEALKKHKKGLMQQLFPSDGENEPKLRFKEFSGEWEEKEIGDLFHITRGNVLSMQLVQEKQTKDNVYPVYSSQTKDNGLAGYYSEYLFENAITWTTDGANAGDVNYRKGKFYCTNVCGVLLSEEGYANQFVAELLNTKTHKHVSYVGNPKLMNGVMSKITIQIPPDKEKQEQQKIANTLSSLDNLIEAQQRKVEALQKHKKGLMQQMFVSGED